MGWARAAEASASAPPQIHRAKPALLRSWATPLAGLRRRVREAEIVVVDAQHPVLHLQLLIPLLLMQHDGPAIEVRRHPLQLARLRSGLPMVARGREPAGVERAQQRLLVGGG